MELTRINNDVNGNPRYVVHFAEFINDQEREESYKQQNIIDGAFAVDIQYRLALSKAKTIGGKKFHNKQYGGGIVFQSYNTNDLEKSIRELKNK